MNVDLITGRTTKLWAPLAHLGAPLSGDGKYGINKVNREYSVKTQALCSYKLTFDFTTESGILSYLDKKTFEIKNIWFVNKLF